MAQQSTHEERVATVGPNGLTDDEAANGVEAQPPPKALVAFVDAVANARYASPRMPAWWRAHAVQRGSERCSYCGVNVREAPMLDPIIPVVAGGPHHLHAVVVCCRGCKVSRGRKDLLMWKPDVPDTFKALRMQVAMEAWNHVSRDRAEMKTKAKAEAVLAHRWSRPRFSCHAAMIEEGGFIGWRDLGQVPRNVPLRLVFEHQAGRLRRPIGQSHRQHADSAIFWIPSRAAALDAIWDVIEHNGLVRSVHLDAPSPAAEDASDPSHDWQLMLPTPADLVRRRWRK